MGGIAGADTCAAFVAVAAVAAVDRVPVLAPFAVAEPFPFGVEPFAFGFDPLPLAPFARVGAPDAGADADGWLGLERDLVATTGRV
jgi:hypothetical protein